MMVLFHCGTRQGTATSRSIPNTESSFGVGRKVATSRRTIPDLLSGWFQARSAYEVIYRAGDPLAFAWALRPRDLGPLLKAASKMIAAAITLFIKDAKMIVMGAKRPLRAAAASNSSPC
jgi:hypothetical protein